MELVGSIRSFVGSIGRWGLKLTGSLGAATIFLCRSLISLLRPPFRGGELLRQIYFIGNRSLLIILLSAGFTGMVLVLQSYHSLARFGSESYIGSLVALSIVRELGPVLAAFMVTARAGSAIAAAIGSLVALSIVRELGPVLAAFMVTARAGSAIAAAIGSMQVTEQVDALRSLSVNPLHYLVAPRLAAALLAVPLLTALFDVAAILIGLAFGVLVLGIDKGSFLGSVRSSLEWQDIGSSLYKSVVFAALIAWIATFRGMNAEHGAEGVGQATTGAVVTTVVCILAADYATTALLF